MSSSSDRERIRRMIDEKREKLARLKASQQATSTISSGSSISSSTTSSSPLLSSASASALTSSTPLASSVSASSLLASSSPLLSSVKPSGISQSLTSPVISTANTQSASTVPSSPLAENTLTRVDSSKFPSDTDITDVDSGAKRENEMKSEEKQILTRNNKNVACFGVGFAEFPVREVVWYTKGTQTENQTETENNNVIISSDDSSDLKDKETQNTHKRTRVRTTGSASVASNSPTQTSTDVETSEESAEEQTENFSSIRITRWSESVRKEKVTDEKFASFLRRASVLLDRSLHLSESYLFTRLYAHDDTEDGESDDRDQRESISITRKAKKKKGEGTELELIASLSDEHFTKDQRIADLDWSSLDPSCILAVSGGEESAFGGSSLLEWNVDYGGRVQTIYRHSSRVTCARYWTQRVGAAGVVIGGTYSGQVLLWDSRAPTHRPTHIVSNASTHHTPASPHQHPIFNIVPIDARHFATADTLGVLAVWDIHKPTQPVELLELSWVKGATSAATPSLLASALTSSVPSSPLTPNTPLKATSVGSAVSTPTSVPSSATATPTGTPLSVPANAPTHHHEVPITSLSFRDDNTFYVASEDGALYVGQRHGDAKGLLQRLPHHHAMISGLHLHPPIASHTSHTDVPLSATDLILTASFDWSVALWNPRVSQQPLASFHEFSDYVTDVKWSPIHPAIFAATDASGALSVWNLNVDREVPVAVNKTAQGPLHRVKWSPQLTYGSQENVLLATAAHSGAVHIYRLSGSIAQPTVDDWARFDELLQEWYSSQRSSTIATQSSSSLSLTTDDPNA